MRKLGAIAKVNDKQTKKVMQKISTGELDIDEGYAQVEDAGKFDDVLKKLKSFRQYISDDTIGTQIRASEDVYNQAMFEIKKIVKRLEQIEKK